MAYPQANRVHHFPTQNVSSKKILGNNSNIQGAACNVTHFESTITHLLYTAINTTEHGQVNQCLGFTKKVSRLQYNVLEMSSMTIKALMPSEELFIIT
jgi:hypothetical protein